MEKTEKNKTHVINWWMYEKSPPEARVREETSMFDCESEKEATEKEGSNPRSVAVIDDGSETSTFFSDTRQALSRNAYRKKEKEESWFGLGLESENE